VAVRGDPDWGVKAGKAACWETTAASVGSAAATVGDVATVGDAVTDRNGVIGCVEKCWGSEATIRAAPGTIRSTVEL
jgi:hypothetical protein